MQAWQRSIASGAPPDDGEIGERLLALNAPGGAAHAPQVLKLHFVLRVAQEVLLESRAALERVLEVGAPLDNLLELVAVEVAPHLQVLEFRDHLLH